MKFLSRLWKKIMMPVQITCPRCLGKGHVDTEDIIRLGQEGKWSFGSCAYCNGSGNIDQDLPGRIPPDATGLTNNLSESERSAFIKDYKWEEHPSGDEKYDDCPVSEYSRLWLEDAFLLLQDMFGEENIQQRKVFIPHKIDFPVKQDASEQSAHEIMKIVASQMEVPVESIQLGFYDDRVKQVSSGSYGRTVFLETHKDDSNAAGLYWGKNEEGKYEVWLNYKNLLQPATMVATLAHEIAHIKLLGEGRIEENNEFLTDLTTLIYGFGVFNANAAFQTFQNVNYSGWQRQGYLSQPQWGYALALFAHIRGEDRPEWIHYLTTNIKSDFVQGSEFIKNNSELIFQSNPDASDEIK